MLANPDTTVARSRSRPNDRQHALSERGDTRAAGSSYAELKALIKQAGLLETQPAYYTYKMLYTFGLLAVSVALLVLHLPTWLQLLDAAFLAIVFTQIGFLFHDIGHRALARGNRRNAIFGLIFGNLLTGVSRAWWLDNHNAHHSHPNELDLDPNIDIPILAFTEEQALRTRGLARFIVTYQDIFLFPIFCLQGFNILLQSILFLRRCPDARLVRREVSLIVLHHLLYVGLILVALGPLVGVLFILIHQGLVGLYSASVFAPNHKGMPVLEAGTKVGFLHQQVLTARNVKGHPVTDFWFGGLNYQIEHHLFPTLPRNKLGKAQKIVRSFCVAQGIDYHETGMLTSYGEILKHFRTVSAPLRA